MSKFLLDSDTCISCLRNRGDIAERIRNVGVWNCSISQITVAELRYGAECSDYPVQRRNEVNEFCEYLSVIPIDDAIINIYAIQKSRLRNLGSLIADFDLLIGATALCHELILVTNNTKHFERMHRLRLENWM